jgi:hypothetical protein
VNAVVRRHGAILVTHWHQQWLAAIRAMTATPEQATGYLDRRLRFTTEVARSLSHSDAASDALVYGVWLAGHSAPIYIGQTTEGRRRLWDLPIGESHHLANSFPPEIWQRVVVVYWGQILARRAEFSAEISNALSGIAGNNPTDVTQAIGLGLEFLLQQTLRPVFNGRKKKRDGSWRHVDWDTSASLGARTSEHLAPLFEEVLSVWREFASVDPNGTSVQQPNPNGRVVFPFLIHAAIPEAMEVSNDDPKSTECP